MIPLFALTSEEYASSIHKSLGKGREHARLLYQEWFRTGRVTGSSPHFHNARALFEQIVALTDFGYNKCSHPKEEGPTAKYLLRTHDALEIEMVVLPMKAGYTLCLSSQVGCRMGCAFCETGKMGLLRSLSVQEIISQVFTAKFDLGVEVRSLVFMGMGEPLDNFDNVMQALQILTDVNGFGLSSHRITLSTSGLVDKIYQLIERGGPAVNLAVSVNGASDEVRSRLMPVNHQYNMAALKEAMGAYTAATGKKILIEYVLIEGRTDSLAAADSLASYLQGLDVTVNLIPYNPQSRGPFLPPSREGVEAFAARLRGHGYFTFVRTTKGQTIMAACGQLGNRAFRKRLSVLGSKTIDEHISI